MGKIVLCDTGILIALFRGNQAVETELDEIGFADLAVSSITVAEIYYGMKKKEIRTTKELIKKFGCFHFNKEISQSFLQLMLTYKITPRKTCI